MLFNSIEFLIFLMIVFVLYWIIPKKFRWILLLVVSYYFYMYWNWKLVFLIMFTTIISYLSSIFIEKYYEKPKIKRSILITSLVLCFGVLIFFKYFQFLSQIVFDIIYLISKNQITGYFSIMLPVGISFYTFQTASYVIDVYNGKIKSEKHFGYYALYVTFFPQLVAGPIERVEDLLPQLKEEKKLKDIDFVSSFRIILVGFFKKIAIADVIGIYVNSVYNDISNASGFSVVIASLLFAVQIFCDFSGYSDIAVGCAKLFGINMTENFNNPYGAKSVKDFWNKWHISLSKWLRDYIYFPLGGSRVKKFRWIINILIVFFVSGIWHGANYTYIIWGLLHGVFQVIGVLTLKKRNQLWNKIGIENNGKLVSCLRIVGTFIIIDFCWIFFRANSVGDAFIAINKIFTSWSLNFKYFKDSFEFLTISWKSMLYILVCILSLPLIEKLKYFSYEKNNIKSSSLRYSLYVLMMFMVIGAWIYLQASDVGSSFIYFQF